MISNFNGEVDRFEAAHPPRGERVAERVELAKSIVSRDPTRYSWTRADFTRVAKGERLTVEDVEIRAGVYRPFFAQHVAFGRTVNNDVSKLPALYPSKQSENVGISVVGTGNEIPFGCMATTGVPQVAMLGASTMMSHFARWTYTTEESGELFADGSPGRASNLNPAGVARFRAALGDDITDDDVFAYVYGILHSPDFRATFETSLKKEAPRVPLVKTRSEFDAIRSSGQDLLDLHVGYGTADLYELTEEWAPGASPHDDETHLLVGTHKMAHPRVTDPETGRKVPDRTRLIYNPYLTLAQIPERAYEYELGTRSSIDWIIDRYYIKTDKASGIVNDPNQWGLEGGQPRYIIDLIKRVVTVSLRTVEIVDRLPKLTF